MTRHAVAVGARARHHIVLRYLPTAAFLLIAVALLVGLPAQARQGKSTGGAGTLSNAFQHAADRWNVPVQVLMAIGYVESRWDQRGGEPSLDSGYGIMHITDRPDGTLLRAVELTGLSPAEIRDSAAGNIEAGAAHLSDISHKLDLPRSTLADWYAAVAEYSGATVASVRDGYAREVYRLIAEGISADSGGGESLVLLPTDVGGPLAPAVLAPESDDYPPALWVPAHPNNYTVGRPYPPLNTVVIHDTEGSYASAISWFQNPNSRVSAHYVIRSVDGQITQMVREANTAWHAGNWDYNVRSIGIEHEGYMNQPGWYTEAMYQSSAALARDVTEQYGIRKDRAHIIAHSEVPGSTHQDPGPLWNWNYYMSLIRRDPQRTGLVDNTDGGFVPVPSIIDPAHYWWVYSGGYGGTNAYMTTSVQNPANSYNSATWTAYMPSTAYYDVYAYIPYVNNGNPDTSSARYRVTASNGTVTSVVSQKSITDRGVGSWAHLGKFHFNGGAAARVALDDYTGESGLCVWFDAVMWIPALGNDPPPTQPPASTPTRTPTRTPTPTSGPPPPTSPPPPPPTSTPIPGPTWTPGPCNMRFYDLPDTHWAYTYVSFLYCRGAISGYPDQTFRPGEGSTRGQFAKMLVLGLGWQPYNPINPSFSDVQPGSTFYTFVEAAYLRGAVQGYPDGTFRPNAPVTRAQAAKMLVTGKGWSLYSPPSPAFTDVPLGHWAYPYVHTAHSHNVVTGYPDGTFRPDTSVTRAQLAKMVALTAQSARPDGAAREQQPDKSGPTPVMPSGPKETPVP
jgi:hypothetical protein